MSYTPEQLKQALLSGELHAKLAPVYGDEPDVLREQEERYAANLDDLVKTFGHPELPVKLLSAPGRTEIGGNHTDHQHGRVLAASVNLDVIAAVQLTGGSQIRVQSHGFDKMDVIDLDDLSPKDSEKNRSAAICRGIAARFQELGYKIGGFDAYTTSNVLKGSGLSSSAAFEVLIGTILSYAFNDGKVDPVLIAQIGQYAENNYFGKPCGLMDQTASSVGSFVEIDFNDPANPIVERVDFDFAKSGYSLCILDTHADHADLTGDYAAIPAEMRAVANFFGKDFLRDVAPEAFVKGIPEMRKAGISDRAILRAHHFLGDNARVLKQGNALKSGDFQRFLQLIVESGNSSFRYLQNIYAAEHTEQQAVSLALALAESLLADKNGGWRVHGGGFAGTIQCFVPDAYLDSFTASMEAVFGKGSCHHLRIRPVGGCCLL